ncbi:hypothetical protein ANN_11065 [Periplaneta americana]|uniref:Tc1-like transposase DDE domain-containing protein n=1 Tax=Periplaneta americana TaxID=6978 RepID=A0ABQ8T591_PERAM|nr:hypothetical protein ANN_11065 [Periplaneta americana]
MYDAFEGSSTSVACDATKWVKVLAVFCCCVAKLLPKLEPNSVIIMDNGPSHSVKADRLPNRSWLKNEIIAWIEANNIPCHKNMVEDELL